MKLESICEDLEEIWTNQEENGIESCVKAHFSAVSTDPAFRNVCANYFDWKRWADLHPDLVAAVAEENG